MSARTAAVAAAIVLLGASLAGALPQQPPVRQERVKIVPKSRKFSMSMVASFTMMPKEIRGFDLWFPIPFEDGAQKIFNRSTFSPYLGEFNEQKDTGNLIYYMKSGARGGVPMRVRVSFDVERHEDLRNTFEPPGKKIDAEAEKAIVKRWLQPERYVPMDKDIKSRASKIVAGKKDPIDRAQAIYDFVVDGMTFVQNAAATPGAGFGDLTWALREMKGNQMDYASVFVGLCRAAGIPARSVIGLQIPVGVRSGTLKEYHGWAEFYLEGIGWIPVDPALGQRDPARRRYYFGALDENRLMISIGRDIVLTPPQTGQPLNYFVNPYWQGDTREMPTPWIEITFEELDEIPRAPETQAAPAAAPPPPPPPGRPRR